MNELFSLDGRVAIVTGGSRGLGAEMASALASAGAHVVLVARTPEQLERRAAEIERKGGLASVECLDVNNEQDVVQLVTRTVQRHGSLDILVNNAGVIDRSPLLEMKTENFQRVMETNSTAPYVLARECARPMAEQGWGRIVNIGSILSLVGRASVLSYTVSKHAIAGLTRALAAELGSYGINVNAILPGYFRTEINISLQNNEDFSSMVDARTPLGRWGNAPELTGPLTFLCSEAASYVNGHLLVVDGGFTQTISGM